MSEPKYEGEWIMGHFKATPQSNAWVKHTRTSDDDIAELKRERDELRALLKECAEMIEHIGYTSVDNGSVIQNATRLLTKLKEKGVEV